MLGLLAMLQHLPLKWRDHLPGWQFDLPCHWLQLVLPPQPWGPQ
jgi:hypothetical protein